MRENYRIRGRLPFDSYSVDDILRNTLKMEIPLDEDHWDNVSEEGNDLFLLDINKGQEKIYY